MYVSSYHAVGILWFLLVPIVGSIIPYSFSSFETLQHFLTGYAGGILLGFGLLHSIPDAIEGVPAIQSINEGYPIATLLIGCTVLLLLFVTNFVPFCAIWIIDNYLKSEKLTQSMVSVLSFWPGLMIHGIFEGLAWGIGSGTSGDWITLTVLFLHKCVEFNALGSIMMQAKFTPVTFWISSILCELPCVIAFIVAWRATLSNRDNIEGYFAAFAAGTFLYLSLCHLIPEALQTESSHDDCIIHSTSNGSHSLLKQPSQIQMDGNCCGGEDCECGNNAEMNVSNNVKSKSVDNDHTNGTVEASCNCGVVENMEVTSITNAKIETQSKSMFTEKFQFKFRGYIGIGLGFATFALLELSAEPPK
eukprot:gene11618-15557_t